MDDGECPIHRCWHRSFCPLPFCRWDMQYDCRHDGDAVREHADRHVLDAHLADELHNALEWLEYQAAIFHDLDRYRDAQVVAIYRRGVRYTHIQDLLRRMEGDGESDQCGSLAASDDEQPGQGQDEPP